MKNELNLGILGTGNMAEALISGLTSKKILSPKNLVGFDISSKRLGSIQKKYKIKTVSHPFQVLQKAHVILLAVKPQSMKELLLELKPFLLKTPQKYFLISIAAGLDTAFFEKILSSKIKLARLMPNTPALVGHGATAYYLNKSCQKKEEQIIETLFGAVGLVLKVNKESLLDAVTGLSGSGPAFVFSFVHALIQGGMSQGLSQDIAWQLALKTVLGAAHLMHHSKEKPEILIAKVASKGGTTEAGLKVLKSRKFHDIVRSTVTKASQRATQLRRLAHSK